VRTNCGRKAKKKYRELGVEKVDEDGVDGDADRRAAIDPLFDAERAALAERAPRHVEEIGDAEVLEGLERDGARVQERSHAQDRRRHVRHDAERAAEGGDDAGARASREARRQRVEHAGAGRDDDDEGGDEKIHGHGGALERKGASLSERRRVLNSP
jgi:hypothetical protein